MLNAHTEIDQNVEKLIKTGIKMYKDDKIIESKV